MVYLSTIPQSTDRPSQSQAQILSNFIDLDLVFDVDHVTFSATADRGAHNQLTMLESAAAPATGADRGMVYTLDNGDNRTELYYRYDNGALGNSKELPLSCMKAFATFTNAAAPVVSSGYNVASVTRITGADAYVFNITFTDALTSAAPGTATTYIVVALREMTSTPSNDYFRYTATTNTGFQITSRRSDAGIQAVSFVVMSLT